MPIFEYEGKKYNVQDQHVSQFAKDFPDATSILERDGKKYRVKSADFGSFMEESQPQQQETPMATSATPNNEEYITGFGQGVKQGTQQLAAGVKYAGGEVLDLVTKTAKDNASALAALDKMQAEGKDVAQETKRDAKSVLLPLIGHSAPAIDMVARVFGKKNPIAKANAEVANDKIIRKALEETNGDVEAARALLEQRANEQTTADEWRDEAAQVMNEAKPTKGAGAWVGNMIPQMVGTAAGLGLSAITKSPLPAQILGLGQMGALTASTAGASMKEARDAGATNGEVWATGLADAAIEFATEAIPFKGYLSPLVKQMKSKTGKAIADVIVDKKSPARKELQNLLDKANAQLGGKLFTAESAAKYLDDVQKEGASEFTAEALQAITPMLYAEPENYPTLWEVFSNGIEGLKGGIFMGSVLGGVANAATNKAQRDRRKEQGFVNVAEVKVSEDSDETTIAEVIDYDDQADRASILINGEIMPLENASKNVVNQEVFTFEEFDRGQIDLEHAESYDRGRNIATPQEKNDALNDLEAQEANIRQRYSLDPDADVYEFMGGDPIAYAMNETDTELRSEILDLVNAKAVYDGMTDGINERIATTIEESDRLIDSHVNKDDNLIHTATLKGVDENSDRKVYIISGAFARNEDGSLDTTDLAEGASMIVMDATSGKKEFIDPRNLKDIAEGINPAVAKQRAAETITNEIATKEEAEIAGTLAFVPNDIYTIADENGAEHTATIVADTQDGNVQVIIDNAQEPMLIPKEKVQQMADAYNIGRANAKIAEKKAQSTVGQSSSEVKPTIPMDEQGKPIYEQAPVEATWAELLSLNDGNAEEAIDTAKIMRDNAKKALDKANKAALAKGDTVEAIQQAKAERKALIDAAQAKYDYWDNVANYQASQPQEVAEPTTMEEQTPIVENASFDENINEVEQVYNEESNERSTENTDVSTSVPAEDGIADGDQASVEMVQGAGTDNTLGDRGSIETGQGSNESNVGEGVADVPSADVFRAEEVDVTTPQLSAKEEMRRKPLRARAEMWEAKVGVKVNLIERYEDITSVNAINQVDIANERKQFVGGWYENGQVYIYLPHTINKSELDKTYIHEVVAHHGMKELLTEKGYEEFCLRVWDEVMSEEDRNKFINYAEVKGNKAKAADEYIARLSEDVDFKPSIWQKIARIFRSAVQQVLGEKVNLKQEDIVDLLRDSYTNLATTSMTDAAAKSGKSPISFNVKTEEELQQKIRNFSKTREGKRTGWTAKQVESIIEESNALINALDKALRGNDFYEAFADREPTIRVDWRDGEAKPTVTWTRANIEYKYDMSGDLLCVNNEGIESVLTSPEMVEIMKALPVQTEFDKAKNKSYDISMISQDYLDLYDVLRERGFVVPCKGCFDAAVRFKMLPSVAQKFASDVNDIVDERNKNPEKFDAELRAKAGAATTIDGLPTTAKTQRDAIKLGVAGDNLTEHIDWTDLISAEGQGKILANNGGIFRAWQRTGAGRPKDKMLPEPYYGDIVSQTSTIIGKYGEKTPSFRDTYVNQGTGLRRNSHSEFRPVLAVDEIQFLRDAFIRNLTVFKYLKELDDVRLTREMGVKSNMSFFPEHVKGTKVSGLDIDGNYIASEESVGAREFPYTGEDGKTHYDGMKGWEEAQKLANKDASLSSVVFSIPHLIKALTDVPTPSNKEGIWGSLIPFHSSGATTTQLAAQGLGIARANGVGHGFDEAFYDYGKGVTNFEDVQNDRFGDGWVILEGKKAGQEVASGHKIEFANGTHYYNATLGVHLFSNGYVLDSEMSEEDRGNISTEDMKTKYRHPFVVDYNDKVREIGTPYAYKEAADYYIGMLPSLGLMPRFSFEVPADVFLQMCADANVDPRHPKLGWKGEGNAWNPIDAESYYSLFCDYGMTDPTTGEWSPHRPVGYINENGEREFRLPDNTIEIVKSGLDRYTDIRKKEEGMMGDAIKAFADKMVERGRLTEAQVEEILPNTSFRFIGEVGASNLDKAEEATTRLDNLAIAREMEAADKSAKTIKMATGWERGADGKPLVEILKSIKQTLYSGEYKDTTGLAEREEVNIRDGVRFRIVEPAPTFYSNAERAAENVKQEKATPEQWLKMIEKNGGLKAGEDKWLGLSDWLKSSDKKTLTKQEVLDFIKENQIQIEEVEYNGNFGDRGQEYHNAIAKVIGEPIGEARYGRVYVGGGYEFAISGLQKDYYDTKNMLAEKYGVPVDKLGEVIWNEISHIPYPKDINHIRKQYTTKGLDNKREIALTVPTIESWNESDEIHFGDAGNGRAIAWVRFGETTDADGNRVLVIDEVQSNRHQEGREKGYRPSNIEQYLKDNGVEVIETGEFYEFHKNGELDKRFSKGLLHDDINRAKQMYVGGYIKSDIPSAPFEKNWAELAMKRMLRYAAENGFDKIAWTTGEQQAERYSLGAVMQGLTAYKTSPNTYYVIPYNNGAIGEFVKEYTEKELAETFGKEIAVNIITNAENATEENPYEMTGDDLRIGGSGMKAFYDQMIPSFMNKYGKKWGVKVGEVTMPSLEENNTMHSIDVTDAMRESVMQGQPMFRISDYDRQFDALQSEYDALDKDDEKALNEWREKKKGVTLSYMKATADDLNYPIKDFRVIASEEDMRNFYEEVVKFFNEEMDYKKFAQMIMKPAAFYLKDMEIIGCHTDQFPNVERKAYVALFHEQTHCVNGRLFSDEQLANIWDEAVQNAKKEKTERIARNYGDNPSNNGDEYLAYTAQRYAHHNIREDFESYIKGEDGVSLDTFMRSANKSLPLRNQALIEILKYYRNGYNKRRHSRNVEESHNGLRSGNGENQRDIRAERGGIRGGVLDSLLNDVAQRGLREMVGEDAYNAFLMRAVRDLDEPTRRAIMENGMRNGLNFHEAAEEYLASLAEQDNVDEAYLSKVNGLVRGMLQNAGIEVGDISNNELRYMLWRSHLQYDGIFSLAEDVVMRSKLGVGNYTQEADVRPRYTDSEAKETSFRIREQEPPKNTGIGYKVFVLKDGKLYPPMVANPDGAETPVGVWLDADAAPISGTSKTGRSQVKAGGKGTQGGSGSLAYRPGWHLGSIPYALQFNRKNPDTGERELFPNNFVWAEVDYANDVDYQEEAMSYGYNKNGKFQHSYAGLPRVPENGAYIYRTNPNPETDPWVITGAMKVNRLLTPSEVDEMVIAAGRTPQLRQEGAVTDADVEQFNEENGLTDTSFRVTEREQIIADTKADGTYLKAPNGKDTNLTPDQWVTVRTDAFKKWFGDWENDPANASQIADANGEPKVVYHRTPNEFTIFNTEKIGSSTDWGAFGMGFYFSPNSERYDLYGKNEMALFLNARNPLMLDNSNAYDVKEPFFKDGSWNKKASEDFTKWVKDNGYDAVVYKSAFDEEDIAFSPNQIKSAEGNTTFDANNDDIRFRVAPSTPSTGKARQMYDEAVRSHTKKNNVKKSENLWHHLREAYQDSMLSVQKLMEAVLAETGNTLRSSDDVYKAENQLSSKNKAEIEKWERDFMKPLQIEILDLIKKGAAYEDIVEYLLAKHGLERNLEFSRREAEEDGKVWDGFVKRDFSGLTELTGEAEHFTEAAQQIVEEFEGKYSTDNLWSKINAATKESLKKSYDSGLMSKETYDKVANMFQYYIPLRGWDNNVAADQYEYMANKGMKIMPALKTAKGRTSRADDPIATLGSVGESSIIQGNRNLMKQKFLNFAQNNPTSLLTVDEQWYEQNADGTWKPSNPEIPTDATADEVDAIIKAHEAKMEALGDKATKKRQGLNINLHTTKWEEEEHAVNVKRNGKEYKIYVNGNPIAAQAINGFTNPNANKKDSWEWIEQRATAVKNFMARAFTSMNPAFVLSNLARDIIWAGTSVAIKENADYARQYSKNISKAMTSFQLPSLVSKWKKGTLDMNDPIEKYFHEFITNGGETGFTQLNTVDDYKRNMERFIKEAQGGVTTKAKKGWRWIWDNVEFLNRSAEDTTRFMVYLTSRQMGRPISESIANAKDITVNFNKKGRGTMGANVLGFAYIFFNATIQSLANFGKLIANHPKKTATALTLFGASGMITPMVALAVQAMLSGDDDEPTYWDLPEWVRRNNIVIYVGGSGYVTIPLPHELRPFYGMGELAFSTLMGKEEPEVALQKAVEGFASLMPFDFTGNAGNAIVNFTPAIAQPLVQLVVNKDYFGTPIYRKTAFNEQDPEWTKAYKSTNQLLVDATEFLNELTGGDEVKNGLIDLNPAVIEHLYEGYLGGMGKTINRAAKTFSMLWDEDARTWRNVPVASSFYQVSDERTSGSQVNREYFDAVDEADAIEHLYSGYRKRAKMGVEEYAEKLNELIESDAFKRYQKVNSYKKAIAKMNTVLKEADPTDREDIETRIMELKVDMLEELDAMDIK